MVRVDDMDRWLLDNGVTVQSPYEHCPICNKHDGQYNIGASQWRFCREHNARWLVGWKLDNSWTDQTKADQKRIFDALGLDGTEHVYKEEAEKTLRRTAEARLVEPSEH